MPESALFIGGPAHEEAVPPGVLPDGERFLTVRTAEAFALYERGEDGHCRLVLVDTFALEGGDDDAG